MNAGIRRSATFPTSLWNHANYGLVEAGTTSRLARIPGRRGVALDRGGVGLELALLHLLGPLHRPLHLRAHVRDGDDDEASLARVEVLAELLEVAAAHARRRVTGEGAEEGAARGRTHEQSATDR